MRYAARIALATTCLFVMTASAWSAPAPQPPAAATVAEHIAGAEKPATGWPALVSEARKYMGTNPTDRKRLWCATFMNFILAKLGYSGTNSDAAKSFAYYGRRISEPRIGAIAVLTRGKDGGHVGVVSGIDRHGNPVIISGNHNDRVGEGIYPRSRVIAYVVPTRRGPSATTQLAARRSPALVADKGFESPIAELIAAIRAEQAHAEKSARRAAPPPARRRIVRQLVAHRVPGGPAPPARHAAPRRSASPLEPLITKLFGPDDRGGRRGRPPYRHMRHGQGKLADNLR